jgi:hypothetical protein
MDSGFSITSAAIATLISAVTSAIVATRISYSNKVKNLDDQLDGLLKIAIQYPYLESEHFTSTWISTFDLNDEKYLRYDVYCTLLFNFLERVSKHYRYQQAKIENFVAIKDWVRLHGRYWKDPTSSYENVDSYEKEFVNLINSYLN